MQHPYKRLPGVGGVAGRWGEKGRNSEKARGADLAIRRVLCCTFFNLVTLTVGCGFYFPIQRLAVAPLGKRRK